MSGSLSVSVVIPATDGPPTLERCREAIERAHEGPDEVVVVDGPPDTSASAARNLGVQRATGDVVVFVDADVEVHQDVFTRLRRHFEDDPSLSSVHGSYDDVPADRSVVSAFRNLLHHHVHHAGAGPAETFWTGLGAVRRDAFQHAGGFDAERYPHPSIEDIELGHRLRGAGGRMLLDPRVQGTHLKRWTLRTMLWTDFARRAVPWLTLQLRSRRVPSTLNLGWRHRISAFACVAAVMSVVMAAPALVAAAVATLIGLNFGFYSLLARKLGVVPALLGIGLHGLHHLVAVAAVPVAIGAWVCTDILWRPEPQRQVDPATVPVSGARAGP